MRMSPETNFLGQFLMPRLDAEAFADDAAYRERMIRLVREQNVGGFCMFGKHAESVAGAVRSLQSVAPIDLPLIFSVDCEFGLPMRFQCGTEFPDAMAIAHTGDTELARKAGEAIAREMRALGLTWNFAPVADVNSNPDNPIINTRSFGDDPETASKFAVPFMLGLQSERVVATAKHFPGHGDTSVDSHRALPFIEGGLKHFEETELPPFRNAIAAGVRSVMTGHLAAPDLADEFGADAIERDLPATLSKPLTSTLLRNTLGFGGVIVTDAMEMRAIRNAFGDADATVKAFLAGADVVLMSPNPDTAYDALMQASREGKISLGDIQSRSHRIRAIKEFAGTIHPDLDRLRELEREHKPLALEIAKKAIECTGSADLRGTSLMIVTDGTKDALLKAEQLTRNLSSLFHSIQSIAIAGGLLPEIDDHTVLAVFHRARGYVDATATEWTVPRMMRELGAQFADRNTRLAGLILFGNPYLDRHFALAPTLAATLAPNFILKTFSESRASVEMAAQRLLDIYNTQ